jgi:hypothetical protein
MSILTPGQLQRIRKFEEGGAAGDQPYVANVTRTDSMMDPITQQLLYGTDGQGGFIPGAFRAAERTFFDEEGRPIVIPQEIAGLSPDQIQAQAAGKRRCRRTTAVYSMRRLAVVSKALTRFKVALAVKPWLHSKLFSRFKKDHGSHSIKEIER